MSGTRLETETVGGWRELLTAFRELAASTPIRVRDLIRVAESALRRGEVSCVNSHGSVRADARTAVYHVLAIHDHDDRYLDTYVTAPEVDEVLELLDRRISRRIPLPYLTGEAFFAGLRFRVREGVFIPRGVIPKVLPRVLDTVAWEAGRVLDLATGCGALGITVARAVPSARLDLADISPVALQVCAENVRRFRLEQRASCVKSDLFSDVAGGPYDLIVSNPPYLPTSQSSQFVPEVRHEPEAAFFGGESGLDLIERIIDEAPHHLTTGGVLLLEVGAAQRDTLIHRYPELDLRWWGDDEDRPLNVCSVTWPG